MSLPWEGGFDPLVEFIKPGLHLRHIVLEHLSGRKPYVAKINSRLKVNDTRAQVKAALDGLGIIMSAEDMVGDHLRAGRLEQVLPAFEAPSRALTLIYPADRTQTAKLKSFVAHVFAALG